jgi:hypothetical protein
VYKIIWAQTLGGVGAAFPESEPFSAKDDTEAIKSARDLDKKVTQGIGGYLGYIHADLYRWQDRKRWKHVKALY